MGFTTKTMAVVLAVGAMAGAAGAGVTMVDGWTVITASSDSRVIYVSSSMGNDANGGLDEASPKKTIEAGYSQMRNGYPDQLLLKRGDKWYTTTLMGWEKGGRSGDEPMVLGAYGGGKERPTIVSTGGSSLVVRTVNYFGITGLHFTYDRVNGHDPQRDSGVTRDDSGTWYLIEDCLFDNFGNYPLVIQSWRTPDLTLYDVRVRRNVIVDTYDAAVYMHGLDGVLFEENILDSIGLQGAADDPGNVVAPQCLYVQISNRNVTVRGNIFCNVASSGVQMRPGGACDNNLFVRNSMGISFGSTYEGNEPRTGHANRNVILDGKNISSLLPRGHGITLQNLASGTFNENIIANKTITQTGFAVNLGSDATVNNAVFNDTIIYGWKGSILVSDQQNTGNQFNRTTVWGSTGGPAVEHTGWTVNPGVQYRNNRYYTTASAAQWFDLGGAAYSFPGWTGTVDDQGSVALSSGQSPWRRSLPPAIGSYNADVMGGAATHEAFVAEMRKQSRLNWRPQYTAAAVISYIRQGFGLTP